MESSNTPTKKRVGILFGGKSAEHEVSIQSAKNVVEALDKTKFEAILIGIDPHGAWHLCSAEGLASGHPFANLPTGGASLVALQPGDSTRELRTTNTQTSVASLDVIFPILHGPLGEDGSMQGFLELAGIPYVGPGVLGSAVGMDKDIMKRILRDAGVPISPFATLRAAERAACDLDAVIAELGLPLFIKPANMGSSVGVSKATNKEELKQAIDTAFAYDTKILIETEIRGKEIECAVLGNDNPRASVLGCIVPREGDFYSYEAKYIDEKGARLEIPADLPLDVTAKAQAIARQTFTALGCEGMSRVDMFATPDGHVIVNEINTIPGFTKISMYPKLWEASGLNYTDLITELLRLAVERFERRAHLQTSYDGHL